MLPHDAEDWPAFFVKHLNAGELEAIVELYEPDARFVDRSGNTLFGRELIRPALARLIESKTRLQSRVVKATSIDDVALLYTDFQGTTVDPSGQTVESVFRAIEVLRRQKDGTWKLIIGDNGRK
jgi:uncharacterized protein (TIGR02246 family)